MNPDTMIAEIGLAERHFNEIEARYRLLTSTWVLATFTGFGFILKTDGLPFAKEIIICAIGIASSIGVQLLWIIDQLVYHRLLDANHVEGFKLELKNPDLPQVRRNMFKMFQSVNGVTFHVRFYYLGCSIIPLGFGAFALILKSISTKISAYTFGIEAVVLLLISTSIFLFFKTNNKWLVSTLTELSSEYEQNKPLSNYADNND